jgi:hypothetical protein
LQHRLAVDHRDPEKAAAAQELKRRYAVIGPDQPHTAWRVLPSGPAWCDPAATESRLVSEARRGQITAESEVERRSRFTVTPPLKTLTPSPSLVAL